MRAFGLLLGVVAVPIALSAVPAHADDELPATFHKGQFGVSARLALAVRGIATYDKEDYCGAIDETDGTPASVCTGRGPLAFDLEASYGVAPSVELALELRVGVERDFGLTANDDGPRPVHLAFGGRFSFSEAKRTKLFVQPMLVADMTDRPQGNDFGVRGIEGFWIDLHRAYGIYVFVGETLEFSRWLSFSFEGGVGFQGRYP
jgi:hypothetical protein